VEGWFGDFDDKGRLMLFGILSRCIILVTFPCFMECRGFIL